MSRLVSKWPLISDKYDSFSVADCQTDSNNACQCVATTFKHFNEFGCQAASRNSNRDNQLGRHGERYFRYGLSISRSYQGKRRIHKLSRKVGCVFSMVIWFKFRMGQYREHQEDAPLVTPTLFDCTWMNPLNQNTFREFQIWPFENTMAMLS